MKVRDIMTTDVATATPETNLEDVATMMRDEDTGAIPVLDDDELIGIITDRDIVIRCIAEGKDPVETTVEDVLTEGLETIEPDADVRHAHELMSRRQVRRLPVVDEGEFVGIISIGDIAVKSDTNVGDTLESVSEGVKASGGNGKRGRSGNTRDTETEEETSVSNIESRSKANGRAGHEESGREANARAGREGGMKTQGRNQQGSRGNGGRQNQISAGNRKQNAEAGRIQESAVGNRKNAGRRVEAKGGARRRAS